MDDGCNDIIMLRGPNGGHIRMARLLLSFEDGDYFDENGEIRPNLPIDYVKAKTWELRPRVKVPMSVEESRLIDPDSSVDQSLANGPAEFKLQDDAEFDLATTVQPEFDENAFYSIDGERYPAGDVKAKVLPKMISFYF